MNNREIKFRGLDKDGNWHYGYLHSISGNATLREYGGSKQVDINHAWILIPNLPDVMGWDVTCTYSAVSVRPETVGQYINLKDKNRKEIFQGDVLKDLLSGVIWEVCFGLCVKHAYTGWYVKGLNIDGRQSTLNPDDSDTDMNTQVEIIGNIYSNPELIS